MCPHRGLDQRNILEMAFTGLGKRKIPWGLSLAGWPSQKHGLSKQQSLLKLSHKSEPCEGHLGRDVSH